MAVTSLSGEFNTLADVVGQWKMIFNVTTDAIIIADPKGIIRYMNSGFTELTGLLESERMGGNIFNLAPDCALAECLRNKQPVLSYSTKVPETNLPVLENALPIFSQDKLIGGIAFLQNASDNAAVSRQLSDFEKEITKLKWQLGQLTKAVTSFEYMIGNNATFRKVVNRAKVIAKNNTHIMLLGEWGTGKELLANAIHQASSRASQPFVTVDCSELPPKVLEAELFGSSDIGAAQEYYLSKLELANGGTFFIKEIGCLNPEFQQRLSTFLQNGQLINEDSTTLKNIDVRIIVSSSKNLKRLVKTGEFREDLYYRLAMAELQLPALRERKDDLKLLTNHFIHKFCRRFGKTLWELTAQQEQELENYSWPGNLNELRDVVANVILRSDGKGMNDVSLNKYIHKNFSTCPPCNEEELITFDEMERILLQQALQKFGDTVEGKKQAANALNISLATLYNKLKKYQLTKVSV